MSAEQREYVSSLLKRRYNTGIHRRAADRLGFSPDTGVMLPMTSPTQRYVVRIHVLHRRNVHEGDARLLSALRFLQSFRLLFVPVHHPKLHTTIALHAETVVVATVEEPEVHHHLVRIG